MKRSICGLEVEISDWTPKVRTAAAIFAAISMGFLALALFMKITVPGMTPITMGITALLLSVRELNVYLKSEKSKLTLILGILLSLLFAVGLCIGIHQMVDALMGLLGQ